MKQNPHTNPVSKISRKFNRHYEEPRPCLIGPYTENTENADENEQGRVLAEISNQQCGPRTLSKFFTIESSSVLNKSYSLSQLAHQKETNKFCLHLNQLNESVRIKIANTQQQIDTLTRRKLEVQGKYFKLKQQQSTRLALQVSRLSSNPINLSRNAHLDNDWSSLLDAEIENVEGRPGESKIERKAKLRQIKQKICNLDLSSLTKLTEKRAGFGLVSARQ